MRFLYLEKQSWAGHAPVIAVAWNASCEAIMAALLVLFHIAEPDAACWRDKLMFVTQRQMQTEYTQAQL